ncbi:MAG: adenosylcobinamide-GDP ribazoletransferase [Loktanella sp.]|nr:adenosylcobinamide-GDP ribazoletransferase [Loktanella sp.]
MKRAAKGIALRKPDNRLIAAIDLPAAFGLLTRLPVPVDGRAATARGAGAVWAYPLVGMVISAMQALALLGLGAAGLAAPFSAALVLALGVVLTGAMHEDGLADSADGLWGGWDKARRLAIMKDSHIGSYGVIALVLTLLLRWLALTAIAEAGGFALVLVVIGGLSRTMMVGVMAALPHARDTGLSYAVGRPARPAVGMALMLGVGLAFAAGETALPILAIVVAMIAALIAKAKIGGQTGDILGAVQQLTEVGLLVWVAARLG